MPFIQGCILLLVILFSGASCAGEKKPKSSTTNAKVVFTTRENSRVSKGSDYVYRFAATDSSGNELTYSVKDLPAWLTYYKEEHALFGKTAVTAAGQYPVHLMATNGRDTAWQHFMLTVYDNKTAKILCLGNSITNGTATYNSYRRDLWQLLHAGNYNVDLIGSWSKHHMGGDVPNPDFDMDHEGHSGWTAQDVFTPPGWDSIRGNINTWLREYTPDIVLLELGTNDVFQCRKTTDIITNLAELTGVLRKRFVAVKIFVAQIPPLGAQWADKRLCGTDTTYAQDIKALNNAIAAFANQYTTNLSPVIAVDQFTGVNPAIDMYDDIHPNLTGEQIMAERWFEAIKPYLEKL